MILPTPTQGDTGWFVHDRFGMFIHWGLYSLGSRHEWVQSQEKIPPDVYAARYLPVLIRSITTRANGPVLPVQPE